MPAKTSLEYTNVVFTSKIVKFSSLINNNYLLCWPNSMVIGSKTLSTNNHKRA